MGSTMSDLNRIFRMGGPGRLTDILHSRVLCGYAWLFYVRLVVWKFDLSRGRVEALYGPNEELKQKI